VRHALVAAVAVIIAASPCSSFAPSLAPALSSSVATRTSPTSAIIMMQHSEEATTRRRALMGLGAGVLGLALRPSGAAAAEEAQPAVCNKILGCEIKDGALKPPERKFKSILEEEEERAKLLAQEAIKARQDKLDQQVMVARGQFGAIRKGRNELEKDVTTALEAAVKAVNDTAEVEKKAWEDVRRMTRLYDTALRKDGMNPAMSRLDKFKVKWERKPAEEQAKQLNEALKAMDRAGKKYDAKAVRESLVSALAALDGWLQLEAKLGEVPPVS